jgi:hypothetical protein
VIVDPAFGVSEETVRSAVVEAEHAWEMYFYTKKISSKIALVTSYSPVACSFPNDLTYYFGARPSEVEEAMKKHTHPVAFANRTEWDIKKGWGKGFIWIAPQGALGRDQAGRNFPDWSLKYNLTGILMHELGHVYGVDHIPQTIMDGNIAEFLQGSDTERKDHLASIDSYRDLSICLWCPFSKTGSVGLSLSQLPGNNPYAFAPNFALLAGRPAVGPVLARVEGTFTDGVVLHLEDFDGEIDLPIEFDQWSGADLGLNASGESQGVFRISAVSESGQVYTGAVTQASQVLYGRLKTKSGQVLPLMIELNMATHVRVGDRSFTFDGLVIKTFIDASPRVLFFSTVY